MIGVLKCGIISDDDQKDKQFKATSNACIFFSLNHSEARGQTVIYRELATSTCYGIGLLTYEHLNLRPCLCSPVCLSSHGTVKSGAATAYILRCIGVFSLFFASVS